MFIVVYGVGHEVPGVVVCLKFHPTFHAWLGGCVRSNRN